jgi:uncharacterized protein (TIGR02996 family)
MSRDEAFLEAVIGKPDEDMPRLVYADWLAGRGDPRGEFIRVQVALERLPPDDPGREALEHRQHELLDRYAWQWAEPLRDLITEWTYRRGFIERVEASLEVPAATIIELFRLAPIRHIRDTGQFCDLDGLVEALSYLRHLTGLEFWGLYGFDDAKMEVILQSPHLAGLQTLILHHDRNGKLVDDEVILRWLLPPRDAQRYFPGMEPPPREANLRELAVNVDGSWRGPSPAIVRAMARSPFLGRLRKLDLSHSDLDLDSVEELSRSPYLSHLEELDLGGCNLMGDVWDAILRLPQVSRLKWLRLNRAIQTDSPGDHMEDLSRIPRYREAFERLVAVVDWDTEFIDPCNGGCWKGFSWWEPLKREPSPDSPRGGTPTAMSPSVEGSPAEPPAYADLLARLTRSVESYDDDGKGFLADLEALEEAAKAGLPADPRLIEAALGEARGYKLRVGFSVNGRSRRDMVVESVLPAFGPAVVPRLLEGYDPTNSWEAAGRLAAICRLDPHLGHRLCHEALPMADHRLQEVILDGLSRLAPEEVERLALEMLEGRCGKLGPNSTYLSHACRALGRLATLSESTTARLMEALNHPNSTVRDAAAWVLKRLGPTARAAVPALHAMLRTPDAQAYSALEALKVIDPKCEADVPELVGGLDDGYYFYRFAMARWLRSLGPTAHAAVPALTAALDDEHPFVRSEAAEALGAIGPAACSAIPVIAARLGDSDNRVGPSAAAALAQLAQADDAAFTALIGALDDPRPQVIYQVIEALKKCEGKFDRAIPSLVAKLEYPEDRIRHYALVALLEQPLPTRHAIVVCRLALSNGNPHLRRAGAKILAGLSPEARSQVLDASRNLKRGTDHPRR